jgi:copper homeostasis protein
MKIELCAGNEAACRIAMELKLDRIELCQQLEIGGVTPGIGLIDFAVNQLQVETHVLIRPRAGGFVFNADEKTVMETDIAAAVKTGVTGLVVGALTNSGELNLNWLKRVQEAFPQHIWTFHRAFDEVKDWKGAMDQLIGLGFTRILTSGQANNVLEGIPVLRAMQAYAAGRIEIMAGGGVTVANAAQIRSELHPQAIHFSGTNLQTIDQGSRYAATVLTPDREKIRQLTEIFRSAQI